MAHPQPRDRARAGHQSPHRSRAASHGVQDLDQPLLQAQFAAMQARAAAAIPGGTRTCLDALTTAEHTFEQHRPGTEPEWIGYFDRAELADEFAHSLATLAQVQGERGNAEAAAATGQQMLDRTEGMESGRIHDRVIGLARALACYDTGDVRAFRERASLLTRGGH